MSTDTMESPGTKPRKGWFRRNIIKAIIILVAVSALTAVTKIPPRDRQVPAGEQPKVNVKVVSVVAEPQIADTVILPGTVEPNEIVQVSAEVSGRVEHIGPKEGIAVRSGQLLVELNSDLLRPEHASAKAKVERDQIQYQRMTELVDINATSQQDLDDARSQLAASKARLEEIQAKLDRTRITAPRSGVLNDLLVEEGEYVQPGTPVAEIVDKQTVKVVADVSERDIVFLEEGDTAQVLISAQNTAKDEERIREGPITFISELADPLTRSTRIEITLDNSQDVLHSGQIVRVRLTRMVLDEAIMIPLLAVIPMENGNAVYVVEEGKAQRRDVELDIMKGDRVQITEGLEPGDRLIIAGHRFVAPGQMVNVVSETGS